ncbi:MAG: outer membrane beta-barrel protein, partial [Proteobacteria bacterium]|nr:outer membrane beta-barrel protein [Pseudomonadota bacterium]
AASLGTSIVLAAAGAWRAQAQAPAPASAAVTTTIADPTTTAALLRPVPDGDPRRVQRLRRPARPPGGGPQNFAVPTFGTPPAAGAGTTGFVSMRPSSRRLRSGRATPRRALTVPRARRAAATSANLPTAASARVDPRSNRRGAPANAATDLRAGIGDQPPRRRTVREDDAFAPVGFHAGAFLVRPALEVTTGVDSNPQHVRGGRGSTLTIIAPELMVRSQWARHALNADIRGNYTNYFREFTPDLSRPFLDSRVNARVDATSLSRFDIEGRLLLSTDNPGSPNIQVGLAKLPIFTTTGGTLGYVQRLNRFEIGARASIDRTAFASSTLTDGTSASNNDRDFNQYGGALRGGYELTPGVKPFVEVVLDSRVHDVAVDRTGAQRDSTGNTVRAGTTFEITRKLTGELSGGYLTRSYKDPLLADLRGVVFDASLLWTASALTQVRLTARATADEIIVAGISGVLRRDVGLQVDHSFRRWLLGTVRIGFGFDDYIGSPRRDDRYSLAAILTYKLTRTVQIKGELRQDWLRSTTPAADYSSTAFLVGLRLQR